MDFSVLSRYDDILASYFVDSLYLWYDTLRMNGDFVKTKVDKDEAVNKIRQHIIGESFTNKAVKDAAESFLTIPYFKEFVQDLEPKQVIEFTQHMKRYLFMYRPNAGFEVGSTTRYTGKPEACLIATKNWKAGEQVTCCLGSIAALTEQDDLKLKSEGRDFSVMVSIRKKCTCLFLGPARFMNHDCDSNCEFILIGQNAITFRVKKDIRVGEEMTVFYAEHYFGENNRECLCSSCERKKQGHFSSSSDENTTPEYSDSDITIDENTNRRSGRKRKDINYKDYYVPEQVKRTRPEITPLADITHAIKLADTQKEQLFCSKDLNPSRKPDDNTEDLSKFNEWIDNLSDVSDDEQEEVVLKCCPQAKEYCMSRVSERPDLCGRCNRHYQIYGLTWPIRKIRKLSWRSKKVKAAMKNNSSSAQVVPPTQPARTILQEKKIQSIPSIQPMIPMKPILPIPVHPVQVPQSTHQSQSIKSVIPMQYIHPTIQRTIEHTIKHTTQSIKQSTDQLTDQYVIPYITQPTEAQLIKPPPIRPQSRKPQHVKSKLMQTPSLESSHTDPITNEPIVISAWPLDKSIPKILTNNLTVEQMKRERVLAINLKRKNHPRKEPYKIVGLDAEIKEKQERLGELELQNIYLLDMRRKLKEIVSKQRIMVNNLALPMLETEGRQARPKLNVSKLEPSTPSISTYSVDKDMHRPEELINNNIDPCKTDKNTMEQTELTEKEIVVKEEPLDSPVLTEKVFNLPPEIPCTNQQDQVTSNEMNEEDTYHPLDTSKNAKIISELQVDKYDRKPSDKIVFRDPETPSLVDDDERPIKQEPEEIMFSSTTNYLLETTPILPPPSSSPPSQQSPMKVSFLLQSRNETPKAQKPCVFKRANIKLNIPRRRTTRRGCPIALPRKEPLGHVSVPSVFRTKIRDAPPPRSIPIVTTRESTRRCSSNSNIGPFVPIEPNNC